MAEKLRVVHFINQFFGQLGAEEAADAPPQGRAGAVGPGMAISKVLGEAGDVVGTVICGDNYFVESPNAGDEVFALIAQHAPDMLIAGPAFNAGRYGVACAAVCKMTGDKLGIPTVTGMYEENPGVEMYRGDVYIVRSSASARDMVPTVERMLALATKLTRRDRLGPASREGYFAQGRTRNELAPQTGAKRAVDMLTAKLRGEPFESELEVPKFAQVKPAPAVVDLTTANIAIVTDGGMVPIGNPDGIESMSATRFGVYGIEGAKRLDDAQFESVHRGYDVRYVNEDPQRLLPVDVLREMEQQHVIGKLHPRFYSTTGMCTTMRNSQSIGAAMAERLKNEGVQAVILTSTWGTSTRCGAAIAKELERVGLPTAQVCTMTPVAKTVGTPRIIPAAGIVHPLGDAQADPEEEKKLRREIVQRALRALQSEVAESTIFPAQS